MNKEHSLKRSFITFTRVIRYGTQNLFRNAWLTIAAVAVMFVALIIILSTVVLNVAANNAINELSKNLAVSIYIKDGVTNEQRNELQRDLVSQEYVANVDHVTKNDARERFTESFRNDEDLLEGLTLVGADSLPASFEVTTTDLDRFNDVEVLAKQDKYADIIDSITLGRTDARRTIERAASVQRFITTGSIVAAAVFTIISILIIFNTIRIAIFTRSEEIRSMKLIGATPGFIRGPFLVETSLYGVIAGIVAVSAIYSLILAVGTGLAAQAEFAETYDFFTRTDVIVAMFVGTILAGILVGIFSSALAMEKYLKLKRW